MKPYLDISEILQAINDPADDRVRCYCGSVDHLCRRECDEHMKQHAARVAVGAD